MSSLNHFLSQLAAIHFESVFALVTIVCPPMLIVDFTTLDVLCGEFRTRQQNAYSNNQ